MMNMKIKLTCEYEEAVQYNFLLAMYLRLA